MAEQNTEYFQAKLKAFGTLSAPWYTNEKMEREAGLAFGHAKADVEFVLDKYRAERLQQLDRIVNKNCYKNKNYNYLQAQKWDEYHFDNDYKLGIINNFTNDHIWKYQVDYDNCTKSDEFKSLSTTLEKDQVYQACHDKFMQQWEEGIKSDLSARAKEVFESSD